MGVYLYLKELENVLFVINYNYHYHTLIIYCNMDMNFLLFRLKTWDKFTLKFKFKITLLLNIIILFWLNAWYDKTI